MQRLHRKPLQTTVEKHANLKLAEEKTPVMLTLKSFYKRFFLFSAAHHNGASIFNFNEMIAEL